VTIFHGRRFKGADCNCHKESKKKRGGMKKEGFFSLPGSLASPFEWRIRSLASITKVVASLFLFVVVFISTVCASVVHLSHFLSSKQSIVLLLHCHRSIRQKKKH